MRRGDCGQRKVSREGKISSSACGIDVLSTSLGGRGVARSAGGSRCALPTKHNRFTKQHPQTSEAKSLLSSSVPLLRQMTGRNRHLSEKAGGGNAADLLSLAQMVAVRKISCALKRRICPTGNMTFRGSTRRLFVAASTRRQNTPPWGTARWESRTYTSTSSGSRGASPCRFFPPFLFEKRKAGAGRGLSGKGENR